LTRVQLFVFGEFFMVFHMKHTFLFFSYENRLKKTPKIVDKAPHSSFNKGPIIVIFAPIDARQKGASNGIL
jgi:hypothetical protein